MPLAGPPWIIVAGTVEGRCLVGLLHPDLGKHLGCIAIELHTHSQVTAAPHLTTSYPLPVMICVPGFPYAQWSTLNSKLKTVGRIKRETVLERGGHISVPLVVLLLHFKHIHFLFAVLGLELGAYTFFVLGFFQIESRELFAWSGFEPQSS
jgi:hypothetical protein